VLILAGDYASPCNLSKTRHSLSVQQLAHRIRSPATSVGEVWGGPHSHTWPPATADRYRIPARSLHVLQLPSSLSHAASAIRTSYFGHPDLQCRTAASTGASLAHTSEPRAICGTRPSPPRPPCNTPPRPLPPLDPYQPPRCRAGPASDGAGAGRCSYDECARGRRYPGISRGISREEMRSGRRDAGDSGAERGRGLVSGPGMWIGGSSTFFWADASCVRAPGRVPANVLCSELVLGRPPICTSVRYDIASSCASAQV